MAFEALFQGLRRRGFVLGVDHQLRLLRLLETLDGECLPQDLASLLCPIFATNKHQQETFRQVFRELYPLFSSLESKEAAARPAGTSSSDEAPRSTVKAAPRPWRYVLMLLLLAGLGLLAGTAIFLARSRGGPPVLEEGPRPAQTLPQAVGTTVGDQSTKVPPLRIEPRKTRTALAEAARWSLTFLPLLGLLVFLLYRRSMALLVLRRVRQRGPPFVWPLEVERVQRPVFHRGELRAASQRLSRRYSGWVDVLDLPATVTATVAAAGRVELRYRASTQVPEYVALVDKRGPGDHGAALALDLLARIEDEGVLLAQSYFFDRDPRRLESPRGKGTGIVDLGERHHGSRLLVFGDGKELLDPFSGRLQSWTESLQDWRDRVLLTPLPLERWGRAEMELARRFLVVPATLDGVVAAARYLTQDETAVERSGSRAGGRDPVEDLSDLDHVVQALEERLGEKTFRWLCACAVHADLQWDLTLFLATLPSLGPGLLVEENLLGLVRLPWFRKGRLPGPLRWRLIQELDDEIEREVRSALVELLEASPPPEQSVALESRDLQMALHQARLGGSRERIKSFSPSRIGRDEADLRLLETITSSALDLVLPKRLRRLLYRQGVPIFGLRLWPLALTSVILALALGWGLLWRPASDVQGQDVAELTSPEMRLAEGVPRVADRTQAAESPEEGAERAAPPEEETQESMPRGQAPETPVAAMPGEEAADAPAPEETPTSSGVSEALQPGDPVPLPGEAEVREPGGAVEQDVVPDWAQVLGEEEAVAEVPRAPAEEPPAVVVAAEEELRQETEVTDGFTAVVAFEPGAGPLEVEVPVGHYRRPVDFLAAGVKRGSDLMERSYLTAFARVVNTGGSSSYSALEATLLDQDGGVVAVDTREERLGEGAHRLRVRFRPTEAQLQRIVAARLVLDVSYSPGPLRQLRDRFQSVDHQDLPTLDPSRITVEDGVASLLVPVTDGMVRLDLLVRPIDYESLRIRIEKKSISLTLWSANPSVKDQFVVAEGSLLDLTGRVLATRAKRRSVEEGERRKSLTMTWRLTPEEVETAHDIRLTLRAEPD